MLRLDRLGGPAAAMAAGFPLAGPASEIGNGCLFVAGKPFVILSGELTTSSR